MQLNFLVIKTFLLLDRTCSLQIGTESNPFIRHVSSEGVVAFGAESHGFALQLQQPKSLNWHQWLPCLALSSIKKSLEHVMAVMLVTDFHHARAK